MNNDQDIEESNQKSCKEEWFVWIASTNTLIDGETVIEIEIWSHVCIHFQKKKKSTETLKIRQ